MTDKFTYMDFQMYVLPGAILELACISLWIAMGFPTPQFTGDGGLFESVVFVLFAFILGHFSQTMAHSIPERFLKRMFWGGLYPSQILYFAQSGMLSKREREVFVARVVGDGLVDAATAAHWDTKLVIGWCRCKHDGLKAEDFKSAVQSAQYTFNRIRNLLTDRGLGQRASQAEASYQFFRGSFTAAGLASALFAIEIWIVPRIGTLAALKAKPALQEMLIASLVLAVPLSLAFFWRARGAGQNFAREVLRAYDASIPASPKPAVEEDGKRS